MSEHFCGTCNRLRLTAEGKLRSCLFSDREVDLRGILRSAEDDRALEASIREAVRDKPERHVVLEPDREECRLAMSRVGG